MRLFPLCIFFLMTIPPITWASQIRTTFVPSAFSSKIEQITVSTLSGKEKKTYGTMDYMYPGKFRYEQEKPENSKVIFVSNQNQSWYYTAPFVENTPGDLIINPMKGKFSLSEFFNVLASGLESNKLYTVNNIQGVYHLKFNPRLSQNLGIESAEITFKEGVILSFGNIKSVKMKKEDKTAVLINLLEVKTDVSFKNDHFIFNPPPNTKITRP